MIFFSIFACVQIKIARYFSIANQNNGFVKVKHSTAAWKSIQD